MSCLLFSVEGYISEFGYWTAMVDFFCFFVTFLCVLVSLVYGTENSLQDGLFGLELYEFSLEISNAYNHLLLKQ